MLLIICVCGHLHCDQCCGTGSGAQATDFNGHGLLVMLSLIVSRHPASLLASYSSACTVIYDTRCCADNCGV